MARPTPISGFPEWLPHERMIEQHILDTIRNTFELHGFAPVETRAVEPLDQLLRKGETDKEIYVLRRLQAEEDDSEESVGLGLHFDLTVPFARYVLENAGKLQFPLRRYQIQKVWRGERPQEGRFREFYQADIDVIGKDRLPFHYEVEMPLVVADALARLPIPPIRIQANNRKIAEGFYRGLGIEDVTGVLRAVDKLDKIGPEQVHTLLVEQIGCTDEQARACLALARISAEDGSFADRVHELGAKDELLDEGLEELTRVVEAAREHAPGLLVADLRIARGLDYYTGTVYETQLRGHESLGSICSGGRYDNLASTEDETYPGVGISIGVTRLVSRLLGQNLLTVSRKVPTCVLVALPNEEARADCYRIAAALRHRGIAAEVAPEAVKYGKQIRFAERRGIPYVWFPQGESGGQEVRDIRSGEQRPADPDTWTPPAEDLYPLVTATGQ
ncbi:histidine--tRNA ligase [Carbonactinospora thermoautotrophica]|uniref:histidine--tRNA ligase n=1 Tax=Carbonactinospora thermoautotrophica TaxID=1469144 RepID=UPI00226F50D9|nr:histidine--tRNA ligase [Carbonactinospora thermoautotrophica]MCX9190544.1 histidine--tRNA ligase [Carbonactinospora thermoautotrophica]